MGTCRLLESMESLFDCGQIEKRPAMTFDEVERQEAFVASPEYVAYKERVRKIITKDVLAVRRRVLDKIGLETVGSPLALTARRPRENHRQNRGDA